MVHVSLGFAQLSDAGLDKFTTGVITNMTGNAYFPAPAVKLTALSAAQAAFKSAVAATVQGGTQATATKNLAREALLALLRQQAVYVQGVALNDLPTLLSSGFKAQSSNKASTPLDTPLITSVSNNGSAQLVVYLKPVTNAKAYEVRLSSAANNWQHGGTFTQSRRLVLENLTPGTTYTLQARAVGGSTGYSNWSDPISHMAT